MKRQTATDDFFDRQPPLTFVEGLKTPVHARPPARFGRKTAGEDEVCADGVWVDLQFDDPEGLLETVLADFSRFAEVCGIKGSTYPVRIVYGQTACFESYVIDAAADGCTVTAADTEGVRRALLFLEDEMIAREGPLLPKGRISRSPWLKSRITRGFFSPTNRPPKNGDELFDDVDYYPDEYLNRLMHDGTNGLWIYSSFRQLVPSDIITEYGVGHERRIEKLNRIVHKCRRYGIKVYVFAIEPAGLTDELAPKYPDMVGQRNGGIFSWTMCPHSERTRAYCYEAGFRLFTLCPGLGGFISITSGERTTSCALPCDITCPRCAALPRGEVLAQNVENLFAGIKAAKPTAECVSWTYDHRIWNDRDIVDYVKNAPESALLMQNFEDRGFPRQLGKERQAMDYWLSYTGPSEMFATAAAATRKHGRQLWAKMQICCSHELATVPYLPSPAHVFEKIRSARRLGVTGIMECWYFGNYPCFMSKAVGDLAFCDDISDETAYLHRLASVCFGHTDAPAVVSAWQHFKKGYRQYPVNIMFSYYSPAHDGVVWELALKPKNFSPSRSWLLLDKPDGDRICDCLLTGHTLDEAITLFSRMKRHYRRALKALSPVCGKGSAAADELGIVSSAVDVLCKSCCNILRFYRLRDELGTGEGDPYKVLAKMRRLVLDEIRQSTAMIALCQKDARLGYHSEAEGYKFFPEKLQHRINTLRTLLATEFAEVKKRIDNGLPPLEYYLGAEEDCRHCYIIKESSPDRALREPLSDERYAFRMAADEENLFIQLHAPRETVFTVQPEFRLFEVCVPVCVQLKADGEHLLLPGPWSEHMALHKPEKAAAELAKWSLEALPPAADGSLRARLRISRADARLRANAPFKLAIFCDGEPFWETEPLPTRTLGKPTLSPGCFGWVKFE